MINVTYCDLSKLDCSTPIINLLIVGMNRIGIVNYLWVIGNLVMGAPIRDEPLSVGFDSVLFITNPLNRISIVNFLWVFGNLVMGTPIRDEPRSPYQLGLVRYCS